MGVWRSRFGLREETRAVARGVRCVTAVATPSGARGKGKRGVLGYEWECVADCRQYRGIVVKVRDDKT